MNQPGKRTKQEHPPSYEPSPQEILDACQRIRSQWTNGDWRKRAGLIGPQNWAPPVVDAAGLEDTHQD